MAVANLNHANLDQLIMLLSADWFFPHWRAIGIDISDEQKQLLQSGFKIITDQIILGAEQYYFIDFSAYRMEETNRLFGALLDRSGISQQSRAVIQELTFTEPRGGRYALAHHFDDANASSRFAKPAEGCENSATCGRHRRNPFGVVRVSA